MAAKEARAPGTAKQYRTQLTKELRDYAHHCDSEAKKARAAVNALRGVPVRRVKKSMK